jgi:uncharacterized Ntn-hydrolase superfamily protein
MHRHPAFALLLILAACAAPAPIPHDHPPVATFSIVAFDPDTNELGIAVQSRFLGVGAVVPWARAGVGAIATQAFANTTYGPRGLELLAQGMSAQEVVDKLTGDDENKDRRQLGVVDSKGRAATFTGPRCNAWAGGIQKGHFCVQGNILAGEPVVQAMAKGFEDAEGDLGDRLIAALAAGQAAGGDSRGMQSAALLIVKEGGGYAGLNDRYRDIRVDDHEQPIDELRRIYELHKRTFRPRRR